MSNLVSLPASSRQPRRLILDGVAYSYKVPSRLERAEWRRDLAETRAVYPGDIVLLGRLRDGVALTNPANADALLGQIDDALNAADFAERAPLLAALAPMVDLLADIDPELAGLLAQRGHYMEVAPLLAVRRFLIGIDGGVAFQAGLGGLVADACLDALPDAHLAPLGFTIMEHLLLSPAAAKNSAAPSPLPPSPAPSETASASIPAPPMVDPAG